MDQSNLGYFVKYCHEYEFLDLSDVDDIERTRLSSALLQKQQQIQQQKLQQQQLTDKHVPASLIKHDAADVQSRVYQTTPSSMDNECQLVLNDNCTIQSNLSCISSTNNATLANNSAETKQNSRLSDSNKTLKLNQLKKQSMPKMSPLVNSQDDASSQQQNQSTSNQQVQQSQIAAQTGNNQHPNQTSTPQSPHQPNQTLQQPPPIHQNHPTSNIPSHHIQSHLYQQSQIAQPHFVSANYIQPSGPGSFYQIMPQLSNVPGVPGGVYFSNFTANVNVSGYTSPMQTQFLPTNAYVQADNHQLHEQTAHSIAAPPSQQYRPSRRGRGRGNYRRDFQSRQMNADINSAQNQQHGIDSSPGIIPQSSNFQSYYVGNPYGCIYPNHQFALSAHSSPAQHATGTPLYGYNGYSYSYPLIYPAAVMPMDYLVDEKSDDGMSNEGQIDSAIHQPNDEYLANQPNLAPPDEFNAQQNEFVPQNKQQHPEQQQPSNEFIMTQTPAEFVPRAHQFVYNAPVIEHHSPHMNSPGFKQQEDASFQTFSNEFHPAQENLHHQHQNIQHHPQSTPSPHHVHHHSQMVETDMQQQQQQQQQQQHQQIHSQTQQQQSMQQQCQHQSDHSDQVNEHVQTFNIVNESQRTTVEPKNMSADIKNIISNSVPKTQQNFNHTQQQLPIDASSNELALNTIENASIIVNEANEQHKLHQQQPQPQQQQHQQPQQQQQQQQQHHQQHQQHKAISTPNGSINGLVQAVNDKLSMKSNKTQQTSAWALKKSTQSVAVSVVPSNNYPHNELNVSKTNNSQQMNKSILDEQSQATKANHQSMQDVTTQHSSEMQTVPVTDFGYTSANSNVKKPVQSVHSESPSESKVAPQSTTPTPTQPATMCWASLFSNSSANSNSRPNAELQKKPIAKVPPYNSSHEAKAINVPTSITQQNITPGVISYSSAASSTTNGNKRQPPTKARIAPSSKPSSSSQSDISIDETSYRLGDFMLKYKIDNNSISLRPRGLTNRSNYCYMNAILQALLACPPFYNLMKSIPLDSPSQRFKTKTPTIDAVVELVSEFSNLPNGSRLHRRDKGGNKKEDVTFELVCDPSFEPKAIHKLWNATRSDNEGRQEDAEEFLGYVLNKLNDEMLELKKLVEKPAETVPNGLENGDPTDDEGNEWQLIGTKNKGTVTRSTDFGRTPVSDIFRGELRSRLQREGDHSTDVMQPFFTLQLNIEKANSVKEALENFVNKDQLEGVTCTKTNQEVNAWQQMTLEKLPIVLILHLKWFDYKGDNCTKILKTVEFPIELKLEPKILSSSSKKYNAKQKQYRLFAVVYHDGKEASKGHYITDVYHTGYLNWIRYDDSTVKRVTEKNVLHPHMPRVPYLLYYRRSDTFQTPTNVPTTTTTTSTSAASSNNANSHNK